MKISWSPSFRRFCRFRRFYRRQSTTWLPFCSRSVRRLFTSKYFKTLPNFFLGSFGHDSVQIFFAMLLFLSVSMASAASASAARWCNAVFEIHAAVNHRWERKRAREREQVREGGRESWHENRYLEKGGIWKRPFSVFVGLVRSCSIIFFSSLEKMLVFFFFDSRSRSKSFWNKTKKKKSRLLKKT